MNHAPVFLMRPPSMSTADDVYHGARWSVVHAPEPNSLPLTGLRRRSPLRSMVTSILPSPS